MAAVEQRAPVPAPVRPAAGGLRWALGAVLAALLLWLVPPFRVVRLAGAGAEAKPAAAAAAPSPAATAEKFWRDDLARVLARAVDATTLVAALDRDPQAAAAAHARRVGLGGSACYLVQGEGKVVAVGKDGVHVTVGGAAKPAFVLETGPVFGNAVRDGTGAFDPSAFASSQDFNAVSAALNQAVEERVLPGLRAGASIGAAIRFAGCAEISELDGDPRPLRLVPLRAEVRR